MKEPELGYSLNKAIPDRYKGLCCAMCVCFVWPEDSSLPCEKQICLAGIGTAPTNVICRDRAAKLDPKKKELWEKGAQIPDHWFESEPINEPEDIGELMTKAERGRNPHNVLLIKKSGLTKKEVEILLRTGHLEKRLMGGAYRIFFPSKRKKKTGR